MNWSPDPEVRPSLHPVPADTVTSQTVQGAQIVKNLSEQSLSCPSDEEVHELDGTLMRPRRGAGIVPLFESHPASASPTCALGRPLTKKEV